MRTPRYRRHSQRNFGFSEVRGQRIRFRGVYNSAESLEDYHALCARLAREHRAAAEPQQIVTESLTVHELCLAYLDAAEAHYERGGRRGEIQNTVLSLRYLWRIYGELPATEFGPLKLAEFQDKLANTVACDRHGKPRKDGRHLSRKYINTVSYRVKRMFMWAVSKEMIPPQVPMALRSVPPLKYGKSAAFEPMRRKPVPIRHVVAVLRRVNRVVRDMLRVQWYLGVRSDSICHAKAEQFDRSGSLWKWRPKHKTDHLGHDLVVFIGPRCQAILKPYLDKKRAGEFLFSPRDARRCVRYRKRYDSATYRRAVRNAIRRVNAAAKEKIPEWTPHQLRHAKGHAVRDRFGIEAAQAVLGHNSIKATQIYSDKRTDLAKLVAEQTG
jgi:integrase